MLGKVYRSQILGHRSLKLSCKTFFGALMPTGQPWQRPTPCIAARPPHLIEHRAKETRYHLDSPIHPLDSVIHFPKHLRCTFCHLRTDHEPCLLAIRWRRPTTLRPPRHRRLGSIIDSLEVSIHYLTIRNGLRRFTYHNSQASSQASNHSSRQPIMQLTRQLTKQPSR